MYAGAVEDNKKLKLNGLANLRSTSRIMEQRFKVHCKANKNSKR